MTKEANKKIIIAKLPALDKKGKKSKGRFCLNCGINIDNRSLKVYFCCPACKETYKERLYFNSLEAPKRIKTKLIEDLNDAASVYHIEEQHDVVEV